ncbi:unnamed protein product [Acanthoscelides obtectus]|uniref:Uncharacterized protein n=1 Tax=Acanthoscelides obtectus TaxID=200917 RepID=A0A9P0P3G9_ACAOB|nr:unnamed protein product [Acanthoscelides obtectus]CAK1639460.1 hypothetical protein AOBTE_LOCUS11189 [Acanthoscelides obtectus]
MRFVCTKDQMSLQLQLKTITSSGPLWCTKAKASSTRFALEQFPTTDNSGRLLPILSSRTSMGKYDCLKKISVNDCHLFYIVSFDF